MSGNTLDKMTIFKAKSTVDKFSVLFDITTSTLDSFNFKSKGSLIEGVVHYKVVGGKRKTQRDYSWISMVNGLSDDIDLKFSTINKAPSAVVGIKITKQSNKEVSFFILTFGMHTLRFINTDKLVNDFGIKVAMNICDPNKLRKVNTTTHSSTSTLTDRQASRGASLDIFDIDDDKEFFRSISGYAHSNYDFIKSFSGRSSIQVRFNQKSFVDNDDLIRTLQQLDIAYKSDSYKENFPTYFGDTITETIKVQIRESQDEVVEALYPIMGKLVKKFIVAEITKLSDSINETIKNKFSFSQIIKRSFKGKKTASEVVLQEVFEPIIEEVFVIEKDSGLLVGSYSKGHIADKDMISGMLTAIKSFAEDAFSKEGQDLEDIKFETFQLSIQNYKSIYIATATSGVINSGFKDKLLDNINTLAEVILRDRSCLSDEEKLNKIIHKTLIKTE